MKKFLASAGIALAIAAMTAPAAAAATAVQPTKASITAWTATASGSSMTTRETGVGGTVVRCRIATDQASDCIDKTPGNTDVQTITNANASRKWFRDLPDGKWKSNKFAANVNPVSDTGRFYAYNPFTPWTAKSGLGVTWDVAKVGSNVVINSAIKNFGDDEPPVTTVTINSSGTSFAIAGKGTDGVIQFKTSGAIKPVTVTIPSN